MNNYELLMIAFTVGLPGLIGPFCGFLLSMSLRGLSLLLLLLSCPMEVNDGKIRLAIIVMPWCCIYVSYAHHNLYIF